MNKTFPTDGKSKNKKSVIGTISHIDLFLHSPGKLNAVMNPVVKSGTGVWKSDMDYNRKKQKQELRKELNSY